jgi:hypothetical protein
VVVDQQAEAGGNETCVAVYWICEILKGQMRDNANANYPNSLINIACSNRITRGEYFALAIPNNGCYSPREMATNAGTSAV